MFQRGGGGGCGLCRQLVTKSGLTVPVPLYACRIHVGLNIIDEHPDIRPLYTLNHLPIHYVQDQVPIKSVTTTHFVKCDNFLS